MGRAREWRSMTCPNCGKDCFGGESSTGLMRLRLNQKRFTCPRCNKRVKIERSSNALK